MFNEFFILQFFLFFNLFLFLFLFESFFLVINSVIYLWLISVYAWNEDIDILINFLLIIDLGLFFIFFSYLINITNLFSFKSNFLNFSYSSFIFIFVFIIILTVMYNNVSLTVNLLASLSFIHLLNYYNYFNILNFIFFTDLQLMAEVYFSFMFFEFILMNFFIYIVIFILFILININIFWDSLNIYIHIFNLVKHKVNLFNSFFKTQNFQKQINTVISTRVWSRKNKSLNDSKTNLS